MYSDGTISYDEMLQYFLSANSLLRERFTHRFEEHTFLGTAVCEHCKGMVRATEGLTLVGLPITLNNFR